MLRAAAKADEAAVPVGMEKLLSDHSFKTDW